MNRPRIVSRDEWLAARKAHLAREKDLTRLRDQVSAERRRLPWVRVEKDYAFQGPDGPAGLRDLFAGRRQLIVYHFMFDPAWDEGCSGCSLLVDNIGHLAHLHARDTSLVLVSRAPLEKVEPFKARMGWNVPWYSSFGSDFNYDFHATLDDDVAPVAHNYRTRAELERRDEPWFLQGEQHGLSVFLREGDGIFHTYSTYARGVDLLTGTYNYLDLTPLGRQEAWEDSPEGWPQTPTYGWQRLHDRYDDLPLEAADSCCSSGQS